MREGDDLFFAPGVRFSEVRLGDELFAEQFLDRIRGYYLEPARACIESEHAFAAGLILVSLIDLLAGTGVALRDPESRSVGRDFRSFVQEELESFRKRELAYRFYNEFRNGLTHEGRIKDGGEFSLQMEGTLRLARGRMCINPRYLLSEIEQALSSFGEGIRRDPARLAALSAHCRQLFATEFGIVERARAV